jgi:hypothetical protein
MSNHEIKDRQEENCFEQAYVLGAVRAFTHLAKAFSKTVKEEGAHVQFLCTDLVRSIEAAKNLYLELHPSVAQEVKELNAIMEASDMNKTNEVGEDVTYI